MQNCLELGKAAVGIFCPERRFHATMPAARTLTHEVERAISSAKPGARRTIGGNMAPHLHRTR
jgi:hypothetical protein